MNLKKLTKEITKEFHDLCTNVHCSECPLGLLNSYDCISLFTLQKAQEKGLLKEPEVDWSKVEIDTKVLVKDPTTNDWLKRYFAKYEDGKVFVWRWGTTSFTSDNAVTYWGETKLYEEGEE